MDWAELQADYTDRSFLEAIISSLTDIIQMADNTRVLHDYDCMQNVLTDYQYTKFKAENTDNPGFETKYNDLKQFMPRTGTSGSSADSPTPPAAQ